MAWQVKSAVYLPKPRKLAVNAVRDSSFKNESLVMACQILSELIQFRYPQFKTNALQFSR